MNTILWATSTDCQNSSGTKYVCINIALMRRITASTPHIVLSDAIIDLIFQNPLFCLLLLLMKWVWNFKCDIQYLFGLCDIFKSDTISTHSTIIITKKPRYVFWIWKYLLWNHIFYYISIITNFRIKNPSLTPDLQMLASIQISACLSYRWSTSNKKTDLSYLKHILYWYMSLVTSLWS